MADLLKVEKSEGPEKSDDKMAGRRGEKGQKLKDGEGGGGG